MRRPDDFLLVSKAAVERLEKSSSGFRQFLARFGVAGGPVRRFPNGAIEINHTKTTAPGHQRVSRVQLKRGRFPQGIVTPPLVRFQPLLLGQYSPEP